MTEFRLYQNFATTKQRRNLRAGAGLLTAILVLAGFRSLRFGQDAWRDMVFQLLIMAAVFALFLGYVKYRQTHPKLIQRIRLDRDRLSVLNNTTLLWWKKRREIDSIDLVKKKQLFTWSPKGRKLFAIHSGIDMLVIHAGSDSFSIPVETARFEHHSLEKVMAELRAWLASEQAGS